VIVSNVARYVVETDGGEGREINSNTFLGLGFIAIVLLTIWFIRRSRA
jgi:LPXTG-motif cell wall-anchored protein